MRFLTIDLGSFNFNFCKKTNVKNYVNSVSGSYDRSWCRPCLSKNNIIQIKLAI